ncbi:helix-turn-helix domain-containing protein [Cellulomonas avistercoris]|uniref:helix-turn-helix domain-containing protein n=1 Tax=Cellulomonas avistercoris TaxID=2762242 RepID=UPI00296AEC64|nr:helix-turn-helix domain-containing protein [Cellulomonas avistercoris]
MSDDATGQHRVVSHLARLLEVRNMSLVQLAALSGITVANLSVLKNGRARAIRFSTLTAVCDVLQCQPGDLLEVLATPGPDVGDDRAGR